MEKVRGCVWNRLCARCQVKNENWAEMSLRNEHCDICSLTDLVDLIMLVS